MVPLPLRTLSSLLSPSLSGQIDDLSVLVRIVESEGSSPWAPLLMPLPLNALLSLLSPSVDNDDLNVLVRVVETAGSMAAVQYRPQGVAATPKASEEVE